MRTEWKYLVTGIRLHDADWELDRLGRHGWELVTVAGDYFIFKRPFNPDEPTSLSMEITNRGEQMSNFSIVITDTGAQVQFQIHDAGGDSVEGPKDSVNTDTPLAPGATVDNTSLASIDASVESTTQPGFWTADIHPLAAGDVTVSPVPLTNSDGSVAETDEGQPFSEGDAVVLTITPDQSPVGFSMAITG